MTAERGGILPYATLTLLASRAAVKNLRVSQPVPHARAMTVGLHCRLPPISRVKRLVTVDHARAG